MKVKLNLGREEKDGDSVQMKWQNNKTQKQERPPTTKTGAMATRDLVPVCRVVSSQSESTSHDSKSTLGQLTRTCVRARAGLPHCIHTAW